MYNLNRFLEAQAYNYEDALAEMKNGRKCSCWMWYVFPQIQGLGRSGTTVRYAIANLEEAAAYLEHEVLGKRLLEITQVLLNLKTNNAYEVFGCPDDMKLKSSMTLFAYAAPEKKIFREVLEKFFDGEECPYTRKIVKEDL